MIKPILWLMAAAVNLFFIFNGDPIGPAEVVCGFFAGFLIACAISITLDLYEKRKW